MKILQKIITLLISLCLVLFMVGCSSKNPKDHILEAYNDLLQYFSKYALTSDKELQGHKIQGEDTYTGSYQGKYDNFSGTEYLFGGTGLERDNGNKLTVYYEIKVKSGSATLYWYNQDNKDMISESDTSGRYCITLDEGDNYLVLVTNNFYGTIQIVVE